MKFKGIIEKEICGKQRGFKFGMASLSTFCDDQKVTLIELQDKLSNPSATTIIAFLYSGALAYCHSKKVNPDFDFNDVADWIDEMGFDEAMKMINDAFVTANQEEKKSMKAA